MLYLIHTSHSNTDLSKILFLRNHFLVKFWCPGIKQGGHGGILLNVVIVTSPGALLPVKTSSVQGVDWLGLFEIKQNEFFPNKFVSMSDLKAAEQ